MRDLKPSMGAEDFSFMLQVKPGAYMRPGAGRRVELLPAQLALRLQRVPSLPLGAAMYAGLAERGMPLQDA